MAKYIRYGNGQYVNDDNGNHPEFPKELVQQLFFGDIIAYNNYRDIGTFFIGKNNTLIENPDFLDGGYLTVPLEITSYFPNAYKHYKNIIKKIGPSTSLVLNSNDEWLIKKFGNFPNDWIITIFPGAKHLELDEEVDYMHIQFDNESASFPRDITYDSIMKYYQNMNK